MPRPPILPSHRPQGSTLAPKASAKAAAAAPSVEPPAEPPTPQVATEGATLEQATTPLAAVRAMLPLLQRIGLHLHQKAALFARSCRLCIAVVKATPEDKKARDLVDAVLDCALLPAITCTSANPGLVSEVWQLLELLPYTSRYRAYGALSSRLKEDTSPELTMVHATPPPPALRRRRPSCFLSADLPRPTPHFVPPPRTAASPPSAIIPSPRLHTARPRPVRRPSARPRTRPRR